MGNGNLGKVNTHDLSLASDEEVPMYLFVESAAETPKPRMTLILLNPFNLLAK